MSVSPSASLDAIMSYKDSEKKKAFISSKFKILQNKKAMAQLSSHDFILLSEALESEKGYSKQRMNDKLKSFALLKIDRVLRGEVPVDDDFVELVRLHGSHQQNNLVSNRLKNNQELLRKPKEKPDTQAIVIEDQPKVAHKKVIAPKNDQPKPAKEGRFKRAWRKIKRGLIVGGIGFLGYFGIKTAFSSVESGTEDTNLGKNKIEQTITPPPTTSNQQSVVHEVKDEKETEFEAALNALNKAYKDRFDSALEIHLGVEKRDQLYQQIDKFAEEGKIEFKEGTTREWYAHAFTMYAQIAPNSEENQIIERFFAGENIDSTILNDLVIKAKRDGTGVMGTGARSNFDKAHSDIQKKHMQNRKNVKTAESTLTNLQNNRSR